MWPLVSTLLLGLAASSSFAAVNTPITTETMTGDMAGMDMTPTTSTHPGSPTFAAPTLNASRSSVGETTMVMDSPMSSSSCATHTHIHSGHTQVMSGCMAMPSANASTTLGAPTGDAAMTGGAAVTSPSAATSSKPASGGLPAVDVGRATGVAVGLALAAALFGLVV